jgi:hypothetical protein
MPPRFEASQLLVFHQRLCDGDRTAPDELAELILGPLVEQLAHRYPWMDDQVIWDGVSEAFLEYCARPHRFDVRRGVPLDRFLHMASWRKVANTLRNNRRRQANEEEVASTVCRVGAPLRGRVGATPKNRRS